MNEKGVLKKGRGGFMLWINEMNFVMIENHKECGEDHVRGKADFKNM